MAMALTTEQVAQKLGVAKGVVIRLIKNGQLATVNPATNGKRVAHRFDAAVINEFRKTYVPTYRKKAKGTPSAVTAADTPGMVRQQLTAIDERLARVEAAIDQLITLWS
jgi:excisionase family DNA binding protein